MAYITVTSPLFCDTTFTEMDGTAAAAAVGSLDSMGATGAVFSRVEEVSDSEGVVDSLVSLDSLGSGSSVRRE